MKPVIIIAIAVVCSVVAVFAVSGGLMLYGEYQYEKAVNDYNEEILRLEIEHEKTCKRLFSHMLSEIGKPDVLQVCLNNEFYLYDIGEICGSLGSDDSLSDYIECLNLWGYGQ